MKKSELISDHVISAYVAAYGMEMLNHNKFIKKYKENENKRKPNN